MVYFDLRVGMERDPVRVFLPEESDLWLVIHKDFKREKRKLLDVSSNDLKPKSRFLFLPKKKKLFPQKNLSSVDNLLNSLHFLRSKMQVKLVPYLYL